MLIDYLKNPAPWPCSKISTLTALPPLEISWLSEWRQLYFRDIVHNYFLLFALDTTQQDTGALVVRVL
jgi:hypothetical protein